MSDGMPAGPALEQLRELIAILRELANAGPRDNSFKQWRQVTLTLLQRLWPGDQTRAVRFRRIPFSAPSSRADAKAIKECYARGVNEAIAYLEGLALELEPGSGKGRRPLARPPEAAAAPAVPHDHTAYMPPRPPAPAEQGGPIEPSPWETQGPSNQAAADEGTAADDPGTVDEPPPAPAHAAPERAAHAKPESPQGPRPRLKDMLGFGDEVATPSPPASPAPISPAASRAPGPAPAASPASAQPSLSPGPPPAPAAPSASGGPSAAGVTRERTASPMRPPPPAASPLAWDSSDGGGRAFDATGSDGDPPPATLREMLDREITPRAAAATRVAHEVLAMAENVDKLGVPPQRRALARAALIDLGQQMDAPPVQWAAIRQALALLMDYPQIARRIIPRLLPYLDEAA